METFEKISDKSFRKISTTSSEVIYDIDELIKKKNELLSNLEHVTTVTNTKVSELDSLVFQAQQLELDTSIPFVPEPVPFSITVRQCRLILLKYNLLDAIDSYINSLGREARITWEYSSLVETRNPLFDAVIQFAGITQQQMDSMLIEASKL